MIEKLKKINLKKLFSRCSDQKDTSNGSKENLNSYKIRVLWNEAEFDNDDEDGDYDVWTYEERLFPEEMFVADDFLEFLFMVEQKYSTDIEYLVFEDCCDFILSEAGNYDDASDLALEILNEIVSFFELQIN